MFTQQFDPFTGEPSRVGMVSHEVLSRDSDEPFQDSYGPTLLAALALEDTEENRARVIKAVDDCPIPIFIPTHRVGDPETEHDEEYHYPAGEDVKGAFMALEHPLD